MSLASRCARMVALVVFGGCVSSALGAGIPYGTLHGTTGDFVSVTEDSGTDTPPLYGTPSGSDDALVFGPIAFVSTSTLGSPAADTTDGQLVMDIAAKAGYYLTDLWMDEAGDYSLVGVGTSNTKAQVGASLFLTILEVNGAAITPVAIPAINAVYSPKANGVFDLVADPGVGKIWHGSAAIDIVAAATIAGVTGQVTKVKLTLDNTLATSSEAQSIAFIAKKQFGIAVDTAVVPEPATWVLLAMGGGALVWMLRRRRGARLAVVLLAVLVVSSAAAVAGPINYGDIEGTSVWFRTVTENSILDTPPLYGTPSVYVDTLVFSPTTFNAFSQTLNPAADLTDGVLTTTIEAKPGATIPFVLVTERGDYSLSGTGTAATAVSVQASIFLSILAVDGVAIAPVKFSQNMVISPEADGTFDLVNNAGVNQIWSGSALLDVQGMLTSKGITGSATKILFSMDNTLVAVSEAGSSARIAKKAVLDMPGVEIGVVPEPSTLALLAMGLGALLLARLRRN